MVTRLDVAMTVALDTADAALPFLEAREKVEDEHDGAGNDEPHADDAGISTCRSGTLLR